MQPSENFLWANLSLIFFYLKTHTIKKYKLHPTLFYYNELQFLCGILTHSVKLRQGERLDFRSHEKKCLERGRNAEDQKAFL